MTPGDVPSHQVWEDMLLLLSQEMLRQKLTKVYQELATLSIQDVVMVLILADVLVVNHVVADLVLVNHVVANHVVADLVLADLVAKRVNHAKVVVANHANRKGRGRKSRKSTQRSQITQIC